MDDRAMLLRKLSTAAFAAMEMHIFLDTHPNDREAMAMLRGYQKEFARLLAEFESKYGPIKASGVENGMRWSWVANPWPWDGVCEGSEDICVDV